MMIEKKLLMQWWSNYKKMRYTPDELKQFEQLIEEYGADRVFDVIITSYICSDGSPNLILAYIRAKKTDELFEDAPKFEELDEEEKEGYLEFKEMFIKSISQSAK